MGSVATVPDTQSQKSQFKKAFKHILWKLRLNFVQVLVHSEPKCSQVYRKISFAVRITPFTKAQIHILGEVFRSYLISKFVSFSLFNSPIIWTVNGENRTGCSHSDLPSSRLEGRSVRKQKNLTFITCLLS